VIGIDVVDIARFEALLDRLPTFVGRFFTAAEASYCESFSDRAVHLAGTFAAKEAAMKAMGAVPAAAFARRVEIVRDPAGAPSARLDGRSVPVSISHDGPVVVAVAVMLPNPTG
jgi:phosphopantetheine--protein transferase-like protein